MCGLAGFLGTARAERHADRALNTMLDQLAHRGPDGRGQVVDDARGVALGHIRLAINGLGPWGNQPIASPDGTATVTVSGEIYDFRRARALLAASGERFHTTSDSELVLALYRRHGLEFVEHLRGEFALALYDAERDRLVLARDRFGVRPLYYHLSPRLVVWASEAKALLTHPRVPRRLCRFAAAHQLAQVMVPGTSAFEGVRAVKPGHLVVVDRRAHGLEVSTRRYWDLCYPHAEDTEPVEPEACVEAVREAVVDALAVRTEADVPVGVYLSGGLDSGALLSTAASLLQQAPQAFTLGFEDGAYDESAVAAQVAQHAGAELAVHRIRDDDLYGGNYVDAVWHSERTFYNTLGVAKIHLSALARKHGFRAVLSGEGADELFAGYPAFVLDHRGAGHPTDGPGDPLMRGAVVAATPQRHPAFEKLCGFTPAWVQPWVSTWRRVEPLLSADARRELNGYDPLGAVAESLDGSRIEGRHRLDIAQYTWIKTMLDGQILSWGGDRVDMANAVESRPVFLDHRLAEVAARIPPAYRVRDGQEKWVLRQALRHVLPDVLYRRRKFPFMAPPAHRSAHRAARLAELTDRYLSAERLAAVGICDPARTRAFLVSASAVRDQAAANEIDKVCNHLIGLHALHALFIP